MSLYSKKYGADAPNYDPYEELANAIVAQAARDYMSALRMGYKGHYAQVKLERFFRSSLFRRLTNVDPEYLITRLREEARKK